MRKNKVVRKTWVIIAVATLIFFGAVSAAIVSMDVEPEKKDIKVFDSSVPTSYNERQVLLCMGGKDGEMLVSWTGDDDGPGLLRCSADKYSLPVTVPIRAQKIKVMGGRMYRFKATVTGLEPGKTYYYEIGDGMVYDSPRFFRAPKEGGGTVFAFLGDPQFDKDVGDYEAWGDLTRRMYAADPDIEFALLGGDMVNLPARKDHWDGFLDNCGLFSMIPVMAIPGNHEGVTSNNTYKKLFDHVDNGPDGEAFYYFDHGNCRFLMLDSSFLTKARQVAMGQALWSAKERKIEGWLRRTIDESPARWNIVVTHHPIYGMHDMFTVSKELRELWLPILRAGEVDLVLCGHQHVYMRTRDIDGMVHMMGVSGAKRSKYYTGINEPAYSEAIYSAGPNYQIIKTTDTELEITSYNEKGSIIDAACIDKDIKFPYFRTFW